MKRVVSSFLFIFAICFSAYSQGTYTTSNDGKVINYQGKYNFSIYKSYDLDLHEVTSRYRAETTVVINMYEGKGELILYVKTKAIFDISNAFEDEKGIHFTTYNPQGGKVPIVLYKNSENQVEVLAIFNMLNKTLIELSND